MTIGLTQNFVTYMNCKREQRLANFLDFMKARGIKSTDHETPVTHVTLGPLDHSYLSSRYHISDTDQDQFFSLYKLALLSGGEFYIAEKPKENGPFIIDIDLLQDVANRQYTESHVKAIIASCNKHLKQCLSLSNDKLNAYILEKEIPSGHTGNKYKDGFHIMYPDFPLTIEQRFNIFDLVKADAISSNLFGDINLTNSYDYIFDRSVVKNNLMLLVGSTKQGKLAYKVTRIYSHDLTLPFISNIPCQQYLISHLSIRKFH